MILLYNITIKLQIIKNKVATEEKKILSTELFNDEKYCDLTIISM